MPAFAALAAYAATAGGAAALTTIGTGAAVGAQMYAAHKQGDALEHGQNLQSQATRQAAEQQARANAEATQLARKQAMAQWQAQETDRRATYDQWRAQQERYGQIGQLLGFNPRQIPDYVPSQQPNFDVNLPKPQWVGDKRTGGPEYTQPPLGGPAQTSANAQMPNGIDPRLAAVYQKFGATPTGRGTGPTDWQYWQNEALANAHGDWDYVIGRLTSALGGGNGAPGGGPTTTTSAPATHDLYTRSSAPTLAFQQMPGMTTGMLPPPGMNPYDTGGLHAYLG